MKILFFDDWKLGVLKDDTGLKAEFLEECRTLEGRARS